MMKMRCGWRKEERGGWGSRDPATGPTRKHLWVLGAHRGKVAKG